MLSSDPVVRMRAADVIEKVSRRHPEYLQPFKWRVIDDLAPVSQQEVRWHVAQMFSYLSLTPQERDHVITLLFSWVDSDDASRIVKVNSLQTLAEFAYEDDNLKSQVVGTLQKVMEQGSPAMKARSKKLLKELAAGAREDRGDFEADRRK